MSYRCPHCNALVNITSNIFDGGHNKKCPIFEDTPVSPEGSKPVWVCEAVTKEDIRARKLRRVYLKLTDLHLRILSDCVKTGSSNMPLKTEIYMMENELMKMGGFI